MPRRTRRRTAAPRTFFNLPSPWNPGYALPAGVDVEGLERGTFTTKQMPRGTYDQPQVGTGGYAVPRYVMDEGYGQGTFVTKWAPRGTAPANPDRISQPTASLVGVRPNRGGGTEYLVDVPMAGLSGLGDVVTPGGTSDPFVVYGQRAAAAVLGRVDRVPEVQRKDTLKLVLDAVDPTLWTTVASRATKAQGLGMAPRPALQRALASAMSDGILKEVIDIGKRGKPPSPVSQVGMGCWGCGMVLGDILEELGGTPIVSDQRGQAQPTTAPKAPPILTGKVIKVGPFTFGATGTSRITVHTAQLPATWKSWLQGETVRLTRYMNGLSASQVDPRLLPSARRAPVIPGQPLPPPAPALTAGDVGLDKWLGMKPGTVVYERILDGTAPFMKVRNEATGTDYGVFFQVTPDAFRVDFKEVPPPHRSWLGKLWDGIKWVAGKIADGAVAVYDAAKDAVGAVADLACVLLNSSTVSTAAAAGAVASGAPPQAGAQGASIAGGLCAGPKVDVPVAPPPGASLTLPLLLGAAGLAAYLLWK